VYFASLHHNVLRRLWLVIFESPCAEINHVRLLHKSCYYLLTTGLLSGLIVGDVDGVRPLAPVDVTATWERAAVHILWHHPTAQSPRPVRRYDIQYRTVGQWVPLVSVSGNATSYDWTTASRGATYQFRLFSVTDGELYSEPSSSVSVQTVGQI